MTPLATHMGAVPPAPLAWHTRVIALQDSAATHANRGEWRASCPRSCP